MSRNDILLTRQQFREGVFSRDKHACIVCKEPAVDAHHIMERRLFPDQGYYLNNGASLCGPCHLKAESTDITVTQLLSILHVERVLPPHLYNEYEYDKWGNIILPNGRRLRGELFHDENIQKILASTGKLSLYDNVVKYPRTHHFPWSGTISSDDRKHSDLSHMEGIEYVFTTKMDGECTTFSSADCYARSLDSRHASWQSWVRALHASLAHEIPTDWRLCGENLFAGHSIKYDKLESFFYLFSIWNERNEALSWDDTTAYADILGLTTVPVLWRGPFSIKIAQHIAKDLDPNTTEGYVARPVANFTFSDFRRVVGKYVRPNHVTTQAHWTRSWEPNSLHKH